MWERGLRMAKFTLRLPDDLQERIQTRADREHRSLHAQIIHLLSEAVPPIGAPERSNRIEYEVKQAEARREPVVTEIKVIQRNPDGTISPYEPRK